MNRICRTENQEEASRSRTGELPSKPVATIPQSAFCAPQSRASALITTLLVLVVLSTIVVAFMQSMSVERSVARSGTNAMQATLAAQSGIDVGLARLKRLMTDNPYHAIGYTNVGGQILTILAGSTNYTNTTSPLTHYLISVTNSTIAPSGLNSTNSIALNLRASVGGGWIGSPLTNGAMTNRECRAPWVYILSNPSLPHQPDATLPNHNPHISRYAYWIEDEASKLDFRVGGNSADGGGFQRTTNSSTPSDLDIGALPLISGGPIPTNNSAVNTQVITFRDSLASLPIDGKAISRAPGTSSDASDNSRFYSTMASFSSDLAGTGQRRVNLNAIVTDGFVANKVSSDIDDIGFVITGTHIFPGLNNTSDNGFFHDLPATSGPMPNFGSRFYSGATVAHQAVYLKKIASNIRDYIDSDSQPTFIDNAGVVQSGTRPSDAWATGSWPQAIGKEAIPYLQEHAWAGREVAWSVSGSGVNAIATATIEIDHYIELFNPNTKDYIAPSGTFIKLSNLPTWNANVFPDLNPADFELDISGVSFPAGKVTVVTTNPGPTDPTGLILDPSRLVRLTPNPATARRFENVRSNEQISGVPGFQLDTTGRDGSIVSDFSSRLTIGSGNGILDAHPALGFSATSSTRWNFKGEQVGNRQRFVYSTSIRGNDASSRSGDPRSLSEQILFQTFNSSNGENTRFYGNIQGNFLIPGNSSLGRAPLSFISPDKISGNGVWGDFTPAFQDTAATAFAVIADAPMVSIGELGNIYDPGGRQRDGSLPVEGARGGGRTLKVGQPDDLIASATRFSTTWQNSAWRLADIFGVGNNRSLAVLEPVSRGKVNVNSVTRDGGSVLRALLRKFSFLPSPQSDSSIAGNTPSDQEIQSMISSMQSYISTNGPIMERGELSQISFFSGVAGNTNTIATKTVSTAADRGREEIFRRMIEMITTRSAAFSIFSVGESLKQSSNGEIKVLGRASQATVFRFDPLIANDPRASVTGYTTTPLYEIK